MKAPRADLAAAYGEVRSLTEKLAEPLSAEDQTVQSMPDVSPTKWHRGHTSWFFETFVLSESSPGYEEFQPGFSYLFNSYYQSVGPRYERARRGCVSRPGCADIARYRAHVDTQMSKALSAGYLDEAALDLVELGLHHEQQHQELLLMDIKHVLSLNPLAVCYQPWGPSRQLTQTMMSQAGWFCHEGGVVRVGHDGDGFAYDNEGPSHEVLLRPFKLADRLVTCAEWVAFIDDGGYRTPELWLAEGWDRLMSEGWEAPLYWDRNDGSWDVFSLGGRRSVDPAEPVCHVSYFEADAFATWAGARLPTEFEWEAVARRHLDAGGDVSGQLADPACVHPARQDAGEMFGGAWVWTSSAYLPYPGFRRARGAVGEYNGKFMVNQHVLRGGSVATPPGHVRASYRNFFPAYARWAFSGVRLAKDI
ncbi:MAG: ergothioneine biosynthesis protein EgtB [Acidimicrobiales bacterium]